MWNRVISRFWGVGVVWGCIVVGVVRVVACGCVCRLLHVGCALGCAWCWNRVIRRFWWVGVVWGCIVVGVVRVVARVVCAGSCTWVACWGVCGVGIVCLVWVCVSRTLCPSMWLKHSCLVTSVWPVSFIKSLMRAVSALPFSVNRSSLAVTNYCMVWLRFACLHV